MAFHYDQNKHILLKKEMSTICSWINEFHYINEILLCKKNLTTAAHNINQQKD